MPGHDSMKSLLTPGIWILAAVLLLQTGLAPTTLAAVNLFYYAVLIAGLLLAWRFHSSRVVFSLLVVFLAAHAMVFFSSNHIPLNGQGKIAVVAVGILLPVNFAVLSLGSERGFTFSSIIPFALFLFVQSVMVAVLCRPRESHAVACAVHHPGLPFSVPLALAVGGIVLLVRFSLFRKPIDSAFFWALVGSFLALDSGAVGRVPTAYFATASLILGVSIVETSYLLAYHDELTTLPSRRAFNDALARLAPPFSIAMVDIDHFKSFNDTYGHDTGDEVLRLVASRLGRVKGGGQTFRCGGEEFAILFPGKTYGDVLEHLERLRAAIEASTFRMRGADRREIPRGPDRRNPLHARGRNSRAVRRIPQPADPRLLSVTVSIGVASSMPEKPESAELILQNADQALYRAKDAGRNRVETASSPRRRSRAKAAGIA
jgi:GGDEF domain-containing protein